MFQECYRLAGGFAAYPSALKPSDPHRDPGPGRVDHLHHHAPVALSDSAHNQGSQHSDHRTLCRAPDHTHVERQQPDGSPPNNITTTRKLLTPYDTAVGRVRHRPRSLTTAGVEVRSSSRTLTSTRNPRSTPTHPHSTRKSQFDTGWCILGMKFNLFRWGKCRGIFSCAY